MGRYDKNGIFSKEEMDKLKTSKVCIVGCGGLGGYILELLARVGIGEITIVDGDRFDESNLNRQVLSNAENLGEIKVAEARKRVQQINAEVKLNPIHDFLSIDNAISIIQGSDIVVDALDSIQVRKVLQSACEEVGIPMIHGAIAGWFGQVTTIMPGDRTLDRLYPSGHNKGVETDIGNPSFTPAYVASIEVSEALKVLIGRGEILQNKMMVIDLLDNEVHILPI